MKIYIKNMVCNRCCLAVENSLKSIGLPYVSVSLGEIDFGDRFDGRIDSHFDDSINDCIDERIDDNAAESKKKKTDNNLLALLTELTEQLERLGFSIISDKKSQTIEQIKQACIDYLEQFESLEKAVLSDYLHRVIKLEYNYLSHLFSVVEGITIEQYFIRLRIEKVKELLVYDELSLGEIAFELGFSSVAHLSGQFKKITGLTPSYFRRLKDQKLRSALDKL